MQVILNYKSYFEAFKVGVIDDGFTPVARLLFHPLFDPDKLAVCDENGVLYVADNRVTPDWSRGYKSIPRNIRIAAGKKETLQVLIDYFNSTEFKEQLLEIKEDDLDEAMIKLVNACDLGENRKNSLLKVYRGGKRYEFYARVFQLALLGENKVASPEKNKSASDSSIESLHEFDTIVRKKKPESPVPKRIKKTELPYVHQLYAAYKDATGVSVHSPRDLDSINYRDHFDRQRKNYYMAETIFRATRDSIGPDENDPFEALKNEMKEGVAETIARPYANAVIKIDSVMEQAARVQISRWIDNASFNWIGPGEKKGVCHVLVNEDRLQWVNA